MQKLEGDRDTRSRHKQAPSELGSSPRAPPGGVWAWPLSSSQATMGQPSAYPQCGHSEGGGVGCLSRCTCSHLFGDQLQLGLG